RPDLLRGERPGGGDGVRRCDALLPGRVHGRCAPRLGAGGAVAAGTRTARGAVATGPAGPDGGAAAVRCAAHAPGRTGGGALVRLGRAGRVDACGVGRVHTSRPVGDAVVSRAGRTDRGLAAVLVPAVRGFGGGGRGDRAVRGAGAAPYGTGRGRAGGGARTLGRRPVVGGGAARGVRGGGGGAAGLA